MRRTLVSVFAAVTLAFSAAPEAAGHATLLDASIEARPIRGGMLMVSIVLWNRSAKMLCISSDDLNMAYGESRIWPSDAPEPGGERRGVGPLMIEHGFPFADSYLFVRPGERREIPLDYAALQLKMGQYRYELLAYYYDCADVASSARRAAKRDVQAYWLSARGDVTLTQSPGGD
jgi:hypothetical protein